MLPYQVKTETLVFGGLDYRIRSLLDRCQYDDEDGQAAARGIPAASWPLFGLVWPAGQRLGETMSAYDVDGKRILEIGCGLALGGLVSHRRLADVTVTDRHPHVERFLAFNLALNDLPPLPYLDVDWTSPPPRLGRYDLILASDVLYEPEHPLDLARFVARHLEPDGEVIIVDPGRRRDSALSRHLAERGFGCREVRPDPDGRMRILHYRGA